MLYFYLLCWKEKTDAMYVILHVFLSLGLFGNWLYYMQLTSYNQYKQNETPAATKQTLSHFGPTRQFCFHPHTKLMPAAPNDNTTDTQESQIK